MKPIEIVCGSCTVIMRLGDELLERVQGHAGRITCKRCGNKVAIDARGSYLVVRSGGLLMEETTRPGPFFSDQSALGSEPATTVAQHWSEFPAETSGSPDEAPSSEVPSVKLSMAPPVPDELKARRAASRAAIELPATSMDAPPPVWRDDGDSLSPHAFGEVEHEPASEDYPLRLPENFKSSPMASNLRDETFKSLYPEPQRIYPSRSGESRFARKIRENAPKPPKLSLPPPPVGKLPVLEPVTPEKEPHSSSWAPWALAAAAVVGLVVNVALGPRGRHLAPATTAASKATTAAPSAAEQTAALRGSLDKLGFLVFDADANWVELTAADASAPQPLALSPLSGTVAEQPETAPPGGALPIRAATAPSAEAVSPPPSSAVEQAPPAEIIQFSPSAAAEAMQQAAGLASSCRRPGDPSGEARMTVTFAPSGRVTSAQLSGPPFAGTATGGCIAKQFRASRVPAFSGERVTMTKVVTIQ